MDDTATVQVQPDQATTSAQAPAIMASSVNMATPASAVTPQDQEAMSGDQSQAASTEPAKFPPASTTGFEDVSMKDVEQGSELVRSPATRPRLDDR